MKREHKYIFCFFLLTSILLSSCKKGIPSEVIQPDKMEALLYDYHIAQAIGNEYNGEERYKKELLLQYVFRKHHTTEAHFDSSLVWYTRNTEKLNKIYERIGDKLKQSNQNISELAESNTLIKAEPISGDTVNIWRWPALYRLSNADLTNKLTFVIPTDTSYKPRDRFMWKISRLSLGDKTEIQNAEIELSIRYQNDSTVSISRSLIEGKNKLCIQSDTLPLKELRGFIYFNGDSINDKIQTLLIHDISLIRYHTPAEEIEASTKVKNDTLISLAIKDSTKMVLEKKDSILEKEPTRLSPKELREQNRPEQIQRKVKPQPKPISPNNRRKQPTRNNNR